MCLWAMEQRVTLLTSNTTSTKHLHSIISRLDVIEKQYLIPTRMHNVPDSILRQANTSSETAL